MINHNNSDDDSQDDRTITDYGRVTTRQNMNIRKLKKSSKEQIKPNSIDKRQIKIQMGQFETDYSKSEKVSLHQLLPLQSSSYRELFLKEPDLNSQQGQNFNSSTLNDVKIENQNDFSQPIRRDNNIPHFQNEGFNNYNPTFKNNIANPFQSQRSLEYNSTPKKKIEVMSDTTAFITPKKVQNKQKEQQIRDSNTAHQNIVQFQKILKIHYNQYFEFHLIDETKKKQYFNRDSHEAAYYNFKPKRINFKKNKNDSVSNDQYFFKKKRHNEHNYHLNSVTNTIYLYNPSDKPIQQTKPKYVINLPLQQNFSPILDYDSDNSRFILFSNSNQEIVFYGINMRSIICRIKIKHQRYNPILYVGNRLGKSFLMIVGGYFGTHYHCHVEGVRQIQFFLLDQRFINLKQRIIKTSIGRISPLVFDTSQENDAGIVILGGNTIATIKQQNKIICLFQKIKMNDIVPDKINSKNITLEYSNYPDINQSINRTGILLKYSDILQFFQTQDSICFSTNLTVKMQNPLYLYNGCIIFIQNNKDNLPLILLPSSNMLHKVRIISKQVYFFPTNYQMLSLPDKYPMKLEAFIKKYNTKSQITNSKPPKQQKNSQFFVLMIDNTGKLQQIPIKYYLKRSKLCQYCLIM